MAISKPNDTTTTLNPGLAGDSMDESSIVQYDGLTAAKRPRVVPGGDDGSLQTFDSGPEAIKAHVLDEEANRLLQELLMVSKAQLGALKAILTCLGCDVPDTDELVELGEA